VRPELLIENEKKFWVYRDYEGGDSDLFHIYRRLDSASLSSKRVLRL